VCWGDDGVSSLNSGVECSGGGVDVTVREGEEGMSSFWAGWPTFSSASKPKAGAEPEVASGSGATGGVFIGEEKSWVPLCEREGGIT